MKITIDTDRKAVTCTGPGSPAEFDLYTKEAFKVISDIWVKVGWQLKYSYTFTWMGRPIIQLPEDMVRTQEAIFSVKPDVIIETGVAHGGSLIFYASLCKAMGKGRVVGVDIEIRPSNRRAVESHPLSSFITLVEGDSVSDAVVGKVKSLVKPGETVLVLLDSCHTRAHVRSELEAYHGFVTKGSYIVATDGIMKDLSDVPAGNSTWIDDNPTQAAIDFAKEHPEFIVEQPAFQFSESTIKDVITYWPGAWLRLTR